VLKQDAFEDVVYAVRALYRDESFYSPSLAGELGLSKQDPSQVPLLSGPERQILTLIAEGRSSQAIAEKLFLSIMTIETHRRNISQKLDLYDRPDCICYAIKIGRAQNAATRATFFGRVQYGRPAGVLCLSFACAIISRLTPPSSRHQYPAFALQRKRHLRCWRHAKCYVRYSQVRQPSPRSGGTSYAGTSLSISVQPAIFDPRSKLGTWAS
jgi:DNA-binding CsgD family transcriptional regulator